MAVLILAGAGAGWWYWYNNVADLADSPLIGHSEGAQVMDPNVNTVTNSPSSSLLPPDNGTDKTTDIDNALQATSLDDGNTDDLNGIDNDIGSL